MTSRSTGSALAIIEFSSEMSFECSNDDLNFERREAGEDATAGSIDGESSAFYIVERSSCVRDERVNERACTRLSIMISEFFKTLHSGPISVLT